MTTATWHPRTRRATLLIIALSVSGLIVAVSAVAAVIELIAPRGDGLLDLDGRCGDAAFSCGIVAGLLISVIPIVVAVLSLLVWRLRRVRDLYRTQAAAHPEQLVEASMNAHPVVGRDGLCTVVQDNLQDRSDRRPYLIVGGVGVGKTAVLVRLTKLLAERGAVPVPIRLRDAQKDLDFMALARRRFLREAEPWLVSEAEGDTIWRKLRDEDRVVVLADGLEEALMSGDAERSRDTAIRLAFVEARDREIPLVVTSRPHDALRYIDAAMLHLEPLSEGAALGFIYGDQPEDDAKVRLIVERAEVVEAPLYMQIGRELHERHLLRDLDTRQSGRLALRVHLLDEWWKALVSRDLYPQAPYAEGERERALRDLEALAVLGLAADNLEVSFADLGTGDDGFGARLRDECFDVRAGATVGARLGVVEAQSTGVRFRHSIMQAYLGSRRVGELVRGSDFLEKALADPGREVLMALVMYCFSAGTDAERDQVRAALLAHAATREDVKALDMLATAVEIGSMSASEDNTWVEHSIEQLWGESRDRATDQAKQRTVARISDLGQRSDDPAVAAQLPPANRRDAYRALWRLCQEESTYPVRLAAAQGLAAGGSIAFGILADTLKATLAEAQAIRPQGDEPAPELQRRCAVQGWILPTLAGSVEAEDAAEAMRLIRGWIDILCGGRGRLSVEASWAQGFKHEANRMPRGADPTMRVFLAEQAERLLEKAGFWFSRISLLHAFSLWSLEAALEDDPSPTDAEPPRRFARRRNRNDIQEAASRIVRGWTADRGHPFVAEAAALCELALKSRTPGRYIWIDEIGVISKLGPQESSREHIGNSVLWISPAAGWLALDERARQLVGEIVLTLNLVERADALPSEQRIQRASGPLPPCLTDTDGRKHLQAAGAKIAHGPRPGSTCKHGCRLHLCPYPAPGQVPFRGELSEAFCRDQQRILDSNRHGPASWQREQRVAELKEFWRQMEARTRL